MPKVQSPAWPERTIMDQGDIHRVLWRVAHQVLEAHSDILNLCFIGIVTRGLTLAQRLALQIREVKGEDIPVASLDIGPYRDDLVNNSAPITSPGHSSLLPLEVRDKKVIIVDDVLFTGRSARAALDALTSAGRPRQVQLAVLVDRGHRELPIKADFVGKNIPTSLTERVQVRLEEIDTVDEVVLVQSQEA